MIIVKAHRALIVWINNKVKENKMRLEHEDASKFMDKNIRIK